MIKDEVAEVEDSVQGITEALAGTMMLRRTSKTFRKRNNGKPLKGRAAGCVKGKL